MNIRSVYLRSVMALFSSCSSDKYYGYVYDVQEHPVKKVKVFDLMDHTKDTYTDSNGYFKLIKTKSASGKLVFEKEGYCSDTIWSIEIENGEQQHEKLKGERIHITTKEYHDSLLKVIEHN
ncbi:carboxypeptidase-like regulatory domain-containing protein [Chitinophagaceae bacterium MMS25-I14]